MKRLYFSAPVLQAGGFIIRALGAPRVSAVLVCAFSLAVAGWALGLSLASAQPALAAGSCQPAAYSLPPALDLTSAPAGLTLQNDGVTHYGVAGSSVSAIRSALNRCAPHINGASTGGYLAYTSYTLSWSYGVVQDGSGCRVSDAKVGLHLSQLQPALLTPSPDAQIAAKWSAFAAAVRTHEDGHLAIDVQQARSLLDSLQSLRASCASIHNSVSSLTAGTLQAMTAANTAHDAATDYGRDQGAVW